MDIQMLRLYDSKVILVNKIAIAKKKLIHYVDNSSNIPMDMRYKTIEELRTNLAYLRWQLQELDRFEYKLRKEMTPYESDESVDYDEGNDVGDNEFQSTYFCCPCKK